MDLVDSLAEQIAKLAIELSDLPPDTPEYERLAEELANWLRIWDSLSLDVVLDEP